MNLKIYLPLFVVSFVIMIYFCSESSVSGTYMNCQTVVSKSETTNRKSGTPEFYLNFSNCSKKITPDEFEDFKPGDQYCQEEFYGKFRDFRVFGIDLDYRWATFSIFIFGFLIIFPISRNIAIGLFILLSCMLYFS